MDGAGGIDFAPRRPPAKEGIAKYLVPKAGLEPARLAPHAPQTCVSAIPPLRLSRDVQKAHGGVLTSLGFSTYQVQYASNPRSLRPCRRPF